MKATFKEYEISAEFLGNKLAPWDKTKVNRNNHVITVRNTEDDTEFAFNFWASTVHPVIDTENELFEAFLCALRDADYADFDFEEFCGELGFNFEDPEAMLAYRQCKDTREKATAVIDDIPGLLMELSDHTE